MFRKMESTCAENAVGRSARVRNVVSRQKFLGFVTFAITSKRSTDGAFPALNVGRSSGVEAETTFLPFAGIADSRNRCAEFAEASTKVLACAKTTTSSLNAALSRNREMLQGLITGKNKLGRKRVVPLAADHSLLVDRKHTSSIEIGSLDLLPQVHLPFAVHFHK